MDIVNNGVRAFPLPAGGVLLVRQQSPGAVGIVALAQQDGATGFTSATMNNANTPLAVGPFANKCVLNVAAAGQISVDITSGNVQTDYTDTSGTPGAATINKASGRAAIAIGAASVVITNSLVTAASRVLTQMEGAIDATLTGPLNVTLAAGSFTVTGNANATAAKKFSFLVVN